MMRLIIDGSDVAPALNFPRDCVVVIGGFREVLSDPQEVRALGQFLQSVAGVMDAERRVKRG